MGLFFNNLEKEDLIGFADAGYLYDPHNIQYQTGYVFTCAVEVLPSLGVL